jgi:hypothetical protein
MNLASYSSPGCMGTTQYLFEVFVIKKHVYISQTTVFKTSLIRCIGYDGFIITLLSRIKTYITRS